MEKITPQQLEHALGPKVSILMLTYNRAAYLATAIQSVIDQSYKDWELILIDDGSTDNTSEIVAAFTDPRIRYINHETNEGLFARRKESLGYVTGTYTAILDSDDYWVSPKKLEAQVAFLESHTNHVLVGTFTKLINQNGNEIGNDSFKTEDDTIRNWILLRNQFTHSSVLMRTTALLKTTGYRPTLAEDLDLFLQLGVHGKFGNVPEYMTAHRIHDGSANDRGVKMTRAVRTILNRHSKHYPNSLLARVKNHLQFLYSSLTS